MININKVMLLILLSTLVSACAAYGEKTVSPSTAELTACREPRPQVCTQEYNPVCASYRNGSHKTDSTGCTACSNSEVIAYKMGACETLMPEK